MKELQTMFDRWSYNIEKRMSKIEQMVTTRATQIEMNRAALLNRNGKPNE